MDERERGKIRQEIKKLHCNLQIETLDFGDFIISNRIVIERKRGDDFISSVYDNRLFIQLYKLKRECAFPIIILENPKKMFKRKYIKKSPIYGALIYIAYKLKIPIITTEDDKDTANVIYQLAKKEQECGFYPISTNQNSDNKNGKEEKVVERQDQEYFLEGLIDVGYKTARKYLDILGSPNFVIQAINQTEIEYTKSGNPKKIKGLMENFKGTGVKLVSRNKRMLTKSYKELKKTKEKTR